MLGFLERERLYQEIYPELDCILLTSKREGSPLVLIEAMQHGVVPVSSRFHGHASEGLLSPGRNSLTFPVEQWRGGTTAAFEAGFARDRAMLARLGQEAKRTAASYTRDSMMNGWIESLFACTRKRHADANSAPTKLRSKLWSTRSTGTCRGTY